MRNLFRTSILREEAGGSAGGGGAGAGTLLGSNPGASGAGSGAGGGQGAPAAGTAANGQGTPVVVESFRKGWIAEDGKINKASYDRLPEHLKAYKETFAKYDTDEQLLQAFAHNVSLNGKKGLLPLPANASESDKAEFNTRLKTVLNVPEKAEGYGVVKPEGTPDEMWNGDYVKSMVDIMHQHNASPDLVKALLEADGKFGMENYGKTNAGREAAQKESVRRLDEAFGIDKQRNLAVCRRVAQTLGIDVQKGDLENNVDFILALHKMGIQLGEDKLVKEGGNGAGGANPVDEAKDIISNTANPLHEAYHDQSHPRYREAIQKTQQLYERAARMGMAG